MVVTTCHPKKFWYSTFIMGRRSWEWHMGRVKHYAYLSYPIASEIKIQHFNIISNTLDKMTILMPPPWELCFLFETIFQSLVWKKGEMIRRALKDLNVSNFVYSPTPCKCGKTKTRCKVWCEMELSLKLWCSLSIWSILHFYPNLNFRDKSIVGHFDGDLQFALIWIKSYHTHNTKLNNFKTNALDYNAFKLVGLWKLQDIC
jgi:hypothetical protein